MVRERRSRNTIEKTFALRQDKLAISPADMADARPEDFMRQFTEYLGILMGYFGRYLTHGEPVNLLKDQLLFNLIPFNLSENETASLMQALGAALEPYLNLEPSAERKRLVMGLVTVPDSPALRSAQAPSPAADRIGPDGTATEA